MTERVIRGKGGRTSVVCLIEGCGINEDEKLMKVLVVKETHYKELVHCLDERAAKTDSRIKVILAGNPFSFSCGGWEWNIDYSFKKT